VTARVASRPPGTAAGLRPARAPAGAGTVSPAGARIAPPASRELPPGFRVVLDPPARVRDAGCVLIGGSPLRLVTLSPRAQAVVAAWRHGRRADGPAARSVARALLDAGLAHPRPGPGGPSPEDVTIIVPVRDRPGSLARCLAALGPCRQVIVVDDASARPELTAQAARATGARVVYRAVNGGPAAARNTGLAHCRTPYVAFADSDCRPEPGWLTPLLAHFRDPAVGVAAPRVAADTGCGGWLARYERARSPLDLGAREGPVVPRSRIAYVPSAALVARREALGSGFAEELRTGEDVDLIWRVYTAGWQVRYEPAAVVRHEQRGRLADWARQRRGYGTSAAPLARRHPGQLPPAVLSPWSLAAWLLILRGRWIPAAGVTAAAAALLARRLPLRQRRAAESARMVLTGTALAGGQLASAVTRGWWPFALAAAACSRRARVAATAAFVLPPAVEYLRRRPALDPFRFTAAYLADDLAYSAGLWSGCIRGRTAAPLLPRLAVTRQRPARPARAAGPGRGPGPWSLRPGTNAGAAGSGRSVASEIPSHRSETTRQPHEMGS